MLGRTVLGVMLVVGVAVAVLGCSEGGEGESPQVVDIAELSELSDDEKAIHALLMEGFEFEQLQIEDDHILVEGDIRMKKTDLIRWTEQAIEKGYYCGHDSDSDPADLDCESQKIDLDVVSHIRLAFASGTAGGTATQKEAIRDAARRWNNAHRLVENAPGSNIYFDVDGKYSSAWGEATVTASWQNMGACNPLAVAEFPTEVGGQIVPGPTIIFNSNSCAMDFLGDLLALERTAIHELGHTLGFFHPEARTYAGVNHISGTKTGQSYETIMHATASESGPTGIFADDALSAVVLFPNQCEEMWENDPLDDEFCDNTDCPCDVGEGDCDAEGTSDQCKGELICGTNNGAAYDLPSSWEVCIKPASCPDFPEDASTSFCTDASCPCGIYEGDCDMNSHCGGRLECRDDIGAGVGMPSDWDICILPPIPGCPDFYEESLDGEFCTVECPCNLGQGDCDSDEECRGNLVCGTNNAIDFPHPGLSPVTWANYADWDFCVAPGHD